MDLDVNPLLTRSKNAGNLLLDSPRAQTAGPFSFARNMHSGQPLRSPFSKLASSGQSPVKPFNTLNIQTQQYSENATQSCGAARLFALRTPGHEYTPNKGSLIRNEGFRSLQTPISDSSLSHKTRQEPFEDSLLYSELGEDLVNKTTERFCAPSKSSQFQQYSFKNESDAFSPPLRATTRTHSEGLDKTEMTSTSAFNPGLPHYRELSADGLSIHLNRRNSVGAVTNTREISALDSRSRSSSIAPLIKEQPADDLSTLMFKGATDLRNAKLALGEQTKQIRKLQDELASVTAEKNLLKQKAKEGLESNAKKLSEMNTLLQSFGSLSRDYFSFVEKTRTSMADVRDLKEIVKESVKQLEHLAGDDGVYAPTQEWKAVLNELRSDVSNKQQVIDMFRDRLEFAQGELADARNRTAELEHIQSQSNDALRQTSERLADAGERLTKLAALLNNQQQENIHVLTKNAELEAKISAYNEDICDLKRRLSEKDNELQAFVSSQKEIGGLRSLIKDREAQLATLREVKERLATTAELLKERETKVDALEVSVKMKSESFEATQKSLLQAEAQLANQCMLTKRLEDDLAESRALVKSELDLRSRIMNEEDKLKTRVESLVIELNSMKKDAEEYRIKLRQSDTRFEMLQERFDNQAMMLRMEKKTHGDLQERFVATEAAFKKTIEDNKRTSELQVNQLKEHVKALENRLHDCQAELSAVSQESTSKLSDMARKHEQQKREVDAKFAAKVDEASQAQQELDDAKVEAQLLHKKIQVLQREVDDLHKELTESKMPSKVHLQEISGLKNQIEILQKGEEQLAQRATAIVSRYETGDLSAEEKRLIDVVHRASQASHEQHLVTKGNEILQRDNTIKALEKRKSELESQLARVLNMQARAKARYGTIEEGRSLIDLDSWMSSQSSSSSRGVRAKAPDRDCPTMDVESGPDISLANSHTPVTTNQALVSRPSLVGATPTARVHQASKSQASPATVPSFAQLATKSTDWSDGINAFDEDAALAIAKRKRGPTVSTVIESEHPRPLRRTRTATRSMQRATGEVAEGTPTKTMVAMPKVKARKRR